METLHNQVTSSEQDVRTPQEVFKSMVDIDPKTYPVITAVERIDVNDVPTAKLFLEGFAEQTALHTEDESIKERPLDYAFGNIRYVVGFKVDASSTDKTPGQQYDEKIAPWAEAYRQLSGQ